MPTIDLNEAVKTIRRFYQKSRRAPSFDEIRELFHYKSKNSAFFLIDKLCSKGLLKKDKKGRLLLDALTGTRVLGTVQAGFPTAAEEESIDTINLDEYLIARPERTFLVNVTGDSMADAGIHRGDLVLVERGRTAKSGDIVIAQVDGKWALKFYEKKDDRRAIGGVVVATIRKYK